MGARVNVLTKEGTITPFPTGAATPNWSILSLVFDRLIRVLLKDSGDRMLEAGQDATCALKYPRR